LDKLKLLKATFLDEPQAVSGMPELYAKLKSSLKPAFFYVSGSPFQLYPFLHDFVADNYPRGPILLKNLTFVDAPSVAKFLDSDGTLEFKLEMIDRINGFYPKKQFLLIGDSTEKDPETYGGVYVFLFVSLLKLKACDQHNMNVLGSANTVETSSSVYGSAKSKGPKTPKNGLTPPSRA